MSRLYRIGAGFCGTVWATSTGGEDACIAYKREDGGTSRSLLNDYIMHQWLLGIQPRIQIPSCYRFITSTDRWWDKHLCRFPPGYSPCRMIQVERIPPFSVLVREMLVDHYCPPALRGEIKASEQNRDCLVRPYLGRRRVLSSRRSRFMAFSLRNFPLHLDQMEELGIPPEHMEEYAKTMADTLAMMHWAAGIDGNDVEFVLASPSQDRDQGNQIMTNILGAHAMWILDFDLCREMPQTEEGVQQAVRAFFMNDPFYPRPRSSPLLWEVFRKQYLASSRAIVLRTSWKLPSMFVEAVEGREAANESHSSEY